MSELESNLTLNLVLFPTYHGAFFHFLGYSDIRPRSPLWWGHCIVSLLKAVGVICSV